MGAHPRRTLDRELEAMQGDLVKLGELVGAAIERALECLERADTELARQIVDDDRRINALRFHVEEECLALIATQQPAASDLRRTLMGISMAGDLERMGDHAAGIAKTVLRLEGQARFELPVDLLRMGTLCVGMLRDGLEAFRTNDAALARQVAQRDDELDQLRTQLVDEVLTTTHTHPAEITFATYLLWCVHNFERMGDRTTNIAEHVIFMTTGAVKELNV